MSDLALFLGKFLRHGTAIASIQKTSQPAAMVLAAPLPKPAGGSLNLAMGTATIAASTGRPTSAARMLPNGIALRISTIARYIAYQSSTTAAPYQADLQC